MEHDGRRCNGFGDLHRGVLLNSTLQQKRQHERKRMLPLAKAKAHKK